MLIGDHLAPDGFAGAHSDREKRNYKNQDALLAVSEFQYGTGYRQANAKPEQDCAHHATCSTHKLARQRVGDGAAAIVKPW
jgi:hypothetical protein